jgi:hypothetical protein
MWSRMLECCHTVRGRATEGLTPEELAVFKRTCETIRTNLSQVPQPLETVS